MAPNTLSNYILNEQDSISPSKLNEIIKNFIDGDKLVYSRFDKLPGVWKCKWYNDDTINGYNRGDFFWLNTENTENFLRDNAEEIKEITDANPYILKKLPEWKSNDEDVFSAYYNVLTGYMDQTKSQHLCALYEIGELSAPNQLIISLKDNNKDPISDSRSWKKFLITDEDYDNLIKVVYDSLDVAISNHELNYHFGREKITPEISASLDRYANTNFSNVDIMYSPNYLMNGGKTEGFDTVEYYVKRPYPNRSLSGYTVENQWFRKWRSGYLEHGGIIDTTKMLNKYLDEVSINFDWDLLGEDSNAYDVKYLGHDKDAIYVDESMDVPPGDNLISVLYELDKDSFKILDSTKAPIYYDNTYSINVIPCYPNVGNVSSMVEVESYKNLGNNSIMNNIVGNLVDIENIRKNSFTFRYNKDNVPQYYYYYAAGFTEK